MPQDKREKKSRTGISIDPALHVRAKTRQPNISAYVERLIKRDLEEPTPSALAPTILVDLARALLGELDARVLAQHLGEADQPRLLQRLLHDLIDDYGGQARAAAEPPPTLPYQPAGQLPARPEPGRTGS